MKKEITVGQLLSVGVTLLIAIITGWVTINNKVSGHEKEIQGIQIRQSRVETQIDRLENKIDKIYEKVSERRDNN